MAQPNCAEQTKYTKLDSLRTVRFANPIPTALRVETLSNGAFPSADGGAQRLIRFSITRPTAAPSKRILPHR